MALLLVVKCGHVIQFSLRIHACGKTAITLRPYSPLAPSLGYFIVHWMLICLSYGMLP